jgi:hypothetical protein
VELKDALSKAACEVPRAPARAPADGQELATSLDVQVRPSRTKVKPGGHVDLDVTFVNKGRENLALPFMVDPLPHFEIEVYDAKGKRIDVPKGTPPRVTSANFVRPDPRTAQVTLDANGVGHLALGWDANRLRWAPEKAKAAAIGADYPRASAGPLPRGRYTLRVVSSLEGAPPASMPITTIDVGR